MNDPINHHSHPFLCDVLLSQVVFIDLQTQLLQAIPNAATVLKMNELLLAIAQSLELPILLTEQYPKGLGATAASLLALAPTLQAIVKTSFSCHRVAEFREALLPARRQVVLSGLETHICVLQTALDLRADGWQVFIAADAVASQNPSHHDNALMQLQTAGCVISSVEALAFTWLKDSKHPQFKTVRDLCKTRRTR